jgi:hypothetical protein
MGLIHNDPELWQRRQHPDGSPSRWRETNGVTWAPTQGPKTGATVPGEFVDTVQPEQWRKHDAQADCDPDALPAQNVRNPAERADDKRPADPVEWAARLIFGGAVLLGLAWWKGWL